MQLHKILVCTKKLMIFIIEINKIFFFYREFFVIYTHTYIYISINVERKKSKRERLYVKYKTCGFSRTMGKVREVNWNTSILGNGLTAIVVILIKRGELEVKV